MKATINQVLVMQKAIRERVSDLKRLRGDVASRESYLYGKDEKKVVEPQYDVKAVDKKLMELEKFLFHADVKVKHSNAVTEIEIDVDMDKLLESIQ